MRLERHRPVIARVRMGGEGPCCFAGCLCVRCCVLVVVAVWFGCVCCVVAWFVYVVCVLFFLFLFCFICLRRGNCDNAIATPGMGLGSPHLTRAKRVAHPPCLMKLRRTQHAPPRTFRPSDFLVIKEELCLSAKTKQVVFRCSDRKPSTSQRPVYEFLQ